MAHKVETMAYTGEVPWHGLGVAVPADLTPKQMLKAAGLDWRVKLARASCKFNGKHVPIPAKGLFRETDGRLLTVTREDWHPVQNEEAFECFADFIHKGGMTMETAGSLHDGKTVWCLAKVNEAFEAVKDDVVQSYFLLTNQHKYGSAGDARNTPTRVVCANTLAMALNGDTRSDQMVKFNHRTPFDAAKVKELLAVSKSQLDTYREAAKVLAAARFSDERMAEYFGFVFPRTSDAKGKGEPSKMVARAMELLDTQPGANFAPGTGWAAFNTTTYIMDHEMGKDANTRLMSSWYGSNRKRKLDALDKALEMSR